MMYSFDGQLGEVSFGYPGKPLPDWRAERDPDEEDEIDEFRPRTAEETKTIIGMLGFDPNEEFSEAE